jgi:hypothetical protein
VLTCGRNERGDRLGDERFPWRTFDERLHVPHEQSSRFAQQVGRIERDGLATNLSRQLAPPATKSVHSSVPH